jgi:hypothetical protein
MWQLRKEPLTPHQLTSISLDAPDKPLSHGANVWPGLPLCSNSFFDLGQLGFQLPRSRAKPAINIGRASRLEHRNPRVSLTRIQGKDRFPG